MLAGWQPADAGKCAGMAPALKFSECKSRDLQSLRSRSDPSIFVAS
jgi:hypothetical protein